MKVLVTTATGSTVGTYVHLVRELAAADRFGAHHLTDRPADADVILFVDAHMHASQFRLPRLRSHALVRRFREKCFVYNELDEPWCALPGLYTSMPRSYFNRDRQRACAYLISSLNPHLPSAPADRDPDLLFSFLGRDCYPPRDRVLRLRHPRAVVEDTSRFDFFCGSPSDATEQQRDRYVEVMARSKFVLCPRGGGTSSYRLFETMRCGRVPVIISDQWVPIDGPGWAGCALRVREADVERVPELVAGAEGRWPQMAAAARRAWEEWFAPDVLFHRLVEACGDILRGRRLPESLWHRLPVGRFVRLWVREAKHATLRRVALP